MPPPKKPRLTTSSHSIQRRGSSSPRRTSTTANSVISQETSLGVVLDDVEPLRELTAFVVIRLNQDHKFDFEPVWKIELTHRYKIVDMDGEEIFLAGKKRDSCCRCCCGRHRGYHFYIFSKLGETVMTVRRAGPLEHCLCHDDEDDEENKKLALHLSPSELMDEQDAQVTHTRTGALYGKLRNNSSACRPQYTVVDEDDNQVLYFVGPALGTTLYWVNSKFVIYDVRRAAIGEIRRSKEIPHKADADAKRGVPCAAANFPSELSPYAKAMVLAAMFEMKVTYFDRVLAASDVMGLFIVFLLLSATLLYVFLMIKYFT